MPEKCCHRRYKILWTQLQGFFSVVFILTMQLALACLGQEYIFWTTLNVCLRFLPYRLLDGFELLLFFSIRYTVQAQDFFYRAGGGPFLFHAGSMALTLTPSRLLPVWEEKRLSVQLRPELATPGYVTCFCRLFDIKKKMSRRYVHYL